MKNKMKGLVVLLMILSYLSTQAQSIKTYYEPEVQRLQDILLSKGIGSYGMYSSIKAPDVNALYVTLDTLYPQLTGINARQAERFLNYYHLYNQEVDHQYNSNHSSYLKKEKGFLKHFFHNPHHLLSVNTPAFSMHVDPIIDIHFGRNFSDQQPQFINTRGAKIQGLIDGKLYFQTQLLENQASFLPYTEEYIKENNAIPGNGLFKPFTSSVSSNLQGYDYLNAAGYLGVPLTKHVAVELGHGRHFVGNGMRSMLLSDFSNNYFYFKLHTKIWRFQYQNIFAELSALGNGDVPGDQLIPKKYMASHYLTFKPHKRLELGLFESVILSRENHLELQYLNPIILFRSIEHQLGSPDNVLLGLNVNYYPMSHLQVYGQILIDELILGEIGNNWWGNKYGGQLGVKIFNLWGIDGLDIQGEVNVARPFTYAQSRDVESKPEVNLTGYTHHKQALAHPLGANFREGLVAINYQIHTRWQAGLQYMYYQKGVDVDSVSYGGNIWRDTDNRTADYGQRLLQGVKRTTNMLSCKLSYNPFPELYVDLHGIIRRQSQEVNPLTSTNFISLGIRYQIHKKEIML